MRFHIYIKNKQQALMCRRRAQCIAFQDENYVVNWDFYLSIVNKFKKFNYFITFLMHV